jgi:hypothetical protein
LVPRFSSTSVAAWTWPTWVVSRRRVLEAEFVLLESSSPSRRIFIGSHSLSPSLVRRIGPSNSQLAAHQLAHEAQSVYKIREVSRLEHNQHIKISTITLTGLVPMLGWKVSGPLLLLHRHHLLPLPPPSYSKFLGGGGGGVRRAPAPRPLAPLLGRTYHKHSIMLR